LIFHWCGELLQRHVGQMVPCSVTFGCTDVQNNQVEMRTPTPEGICHCVAERVIAKETLSACPSFNKPFQICTNASHCQLGVSQEGKPTAFCGRELNSVQTRCTTAERELLSTTETLKEHWNMLLGQEIEVFTHHKNPVHLQLQTRTSQCSQLQQCVHRGVSRLPLVGIEPSLSTKEPLVLRVGGSN